jgi:hypothetical protein
MENQEMSRDEDTAPISDQFRFLNEEELATSAELSETTKCE